MVVLSLCGVTFLEIVFLWLFCFFLFCLWLFFLTLAVILNFSLICFVVSNYFLSLWSCLTSLSLSIFLCLYLWFCLLLFNLFVAVFHPSRPFNKPDTSLLRSTFNNNLHTVWILFNTRSRRFHDEHNTFILKSAIIHITCKNGMCVLVEKPHNCVFQPVNSICQYSVFVSTCWVPYE